MLPFYDSFENTRMWSLMSTKDIIIVASSWLVNGSKCIMLLKLQ